jgi:hypothetical protein
LKLWQLLHTCWLPNTYQNWQEYEVSVMLIHVLNIKLTWEWHEAIKLIYKNIFKHLIVVFRVPFAIHDSWVASADVTPHLTQGQTLIKTCQLIATVCWPDIRPHFSLAIISVTVQLWT